MDTAFQIGDDEAGGEAGDNLAAEPLGGLGAGGHCPLLCFEPADRVVERRDSSEFSIPLSRMWRRLSRAAAMKRSAANTSTPISPATTAVNPMSA